jgi:hypothetical protein
VILDIAPNIFDELQISYDDLSFFAELGADGLRLTLVLTVTRRRPYHLIHMA